MTVTGLLDRISSAINGYFSKGLIADSDAVGFIRSTYGISDPDDVAALIERGEDSGAVTDIVSYPPDHFRESVEELIPPEGLSADSIKTVEELSGTENVFILYQGRKIFPGESDSLFCRQRFIQRLNLDIPFNYLSDSVPVQGKDDFYKIRSLLRKRKFVPDGPETVNEEKSRFISDLLNRYLSADNFFSLPTAGNAYPANGGPDTQHGIVELVDFTADLFRDRNSRPFDILAEKKYFYENAIIEAEEFTRLLKSSSMEFIMMKRIQPPLIPADEARRMISIIDRLTSTVYGMIIPSIRNVVEEIF